MWRDLALGVLVLSGARSVAAQGVESARPAVRLGAGVSSADYSCTGCQVDAETGFTALLAGTRPLGQSLTAGIETTLSRATGGQSEVTLLGALATVGARGGPRTPLWGTIGFGWLWYSGTGPNSNGPALSARTGVDLAIAPRVALSPYAGYLTMLGHDGPRTVVGPVSTPEDPGIPTRVASLQVGVALTFMP
jgi:hypothetical protein